jgi:predicted lipid-binding transport protein (Tim44 family)
MLWAIGWWIVRREVRRRASHAASNVASGAASRRGRLRAVFGALLLVGVIAGGLVTWRRLAAGSDKPEPPASAPPAPAGPSADASAAPPAPAGPSADASAA